MKTFIYSEDIESYLGYCKGLSLDPNETFHYSDKEKMIKDYLSNNERGVDTQLLSVDGDIDWEKEITAKE